MTSPRLLGEFEHLLLLAVLRLDDGAHGVAIRQVIEARTGRLVSPGAIYTTLDRLERRGYVSTSLGDPTPQRGGKRRRFYRLRPAAAAAIREAQAQVASMSSGLRPKLEPQ
jgi:PadR family transcriptional regulator PadR